MPTNKARKAPASAPTPAAPTPAAPTALTFTRYTSTQPAVLCKRIGLDGAGRLNKTAAATMQRGHAETMQAHGLAELLALLDALAPAQAVGWGVMKAAPYPGGRVPIVTKAEKERADAVAELGTRSADAMAWPAGAGVLMLDHDDGHNGERLDVDELRARLVEACPALADAPMLWRPSSSAGLVSADGRELAGLHKHRLYVPVTRAADIPSAAARLVTLLWAASKDKPGRFAWCTVGNAGQVLRRSLVDESVWQANRLDFAAPPLLADGLTRPRVAGRVFGDPLALFDLAGIVTTDADERAAAQAQASARKAVQTAAAAQAEKWAEERAPVLAKARGIPVDKARAVLLRAAGERRVLMGDFLLTASDGKAVSVGELLDGADRWHNRRFFDPLDPDADGRVAVVNLRSGGRPYLFTHRHGGLRFELMRQSARVQVGNGRRIEATDAVLQVLRDRGELYEFGEGAVAYVAEGRARPVSPDWLADHMGRACEFYSARTQVADDGMVVQRELPQDPPPAIARAILAKHGERGFLRLVGVVTAPTLRRDGSILDRPGHDAASGLLYWCDRAAPAVPQAPTPADALAALRRLWAPVCMFPLVDDVARGVVLHGMLTAVLRASLPTAPGLGFDAPAAGSGKTLLARCIGILATGHEASILPPAADEDEARKRLFSALREGRRVVLWDNVRDPLGNAALDAFLTADTFADRVLGVSEVASLPNRALFIATGNNLRLVGDTCRRVLVARMDAQSETPYARDFDFDPAEQTQRDRLALVVAALTIIRAHITAGRPKAAEGRAASFEAWDDLVRQPLCWLAGLVRDHNERGDDDPLPDLADPLEAARRAFDDDPETTKLVALLSAWFAAFDNVPTTLAGAIRRALAQPTTDAPLFDALDEVGGQGGKINPRIVARWIERNQGRIVAGLRIERGARSSAGPTWRVVRQSTARPPAEKPSTESTKSTAGGRKNPPLGAVSALSALDAQFPDQPVNQVSADEQAGADLV